MHSDVLELFVIQNTVPVIHLARTEEEENSSEMILKAGRIAAQDLLGEETTGELIQVEILSKSSIFYSRLDDILLALRVSNSMSHSGATYLLSDIIQLVTGYYEIISSSSGNVSVLKSLIKRLKNLLGANLLTDPLGLAQINHIMEEYFSENLHIDTIGLVTQESWLVNYSSREGRKVGRLSEDVWKHGIEIIHSSLGQLNLGALIQGEEAVFWIRPIYFKNVSSVTGVSWWGLIVQINLEVVKNTIEIKSINTGPRRVYNLPSEFYNKFIQELDYSFFPKIEDPVRLMVERALKGRNRSEPLNKVLSYVEYNLEDDKICELESFVEAGTFFDPKLPKSKLYTWDEFIKKYLGQNLKAPDSSKNIINTYHTIYTSLTLNNINKLYDCLLKISSKITPVTLHVGQQNCLDRNIPILRIFNQKKVTIIIYTEEDFELEVAKNSIKIMGNIDENIELDQYSFLIIESENYNSGFLFFADTEKKYSGFFTHSLSIIEIILSRVKNLGEIE